MLNDKLATQFVADLSRLVARPLMLQRSDAWSVHGFCGWQENERGVQKFLKNF